MVLGNGWRSFVRETIHCSVAFEPQTPQRHKPPTQRAGFAISIHSHPFDVYYYYTFSRSLNRTMVYV